MVPGEVKLGNSWMRSVTFCLYRGSPGAYAFSTKDLNTLYDPSWIRYYEIIKFIRGEFGERRVFLERGHRG